LNEEHHCRKARATRKIDLAKPQQADRHLFGARVNKHRHFWREQPALLLSLSLIIGVSSYLFWSFPWNWIFPLCWSAYLIFLRRFAPLLLLLGGVIYSGCFFRASPTLGEQEAYFSISSLKIHQSPFEKSLLYQGTLTVSNTQVPASIYWRGPKHPPANRDYILSGQLIPRGSYEYLFKPKSWKAVKNTWSLAELRYKMKKRLRALLERKLQKPRTASFLNALLTGEVQDRSLRYEFSKLGLQHVLAISGFHFGVLIAFCSFFLSLFLPHRLRLFVLLLAVSSYFLFIGSVPAVQRSWLTAALYLIGKLIGRHSTGLNLLGLAALIEVILNPLIPANLGFQLSFLSCSGILLYYPLFEKKLCALFPKRGKEDTAQLSFLSLHVSGLSSYLRKALSLSLAVNLVLSPLLLYYFHQVPTLSLIYNLFFPFLVSIALFGFLIAWILYLVWAPIGNILLQIIDFFTSELLDLIAYPPIALDYSLCTSSIQSWAIPLYLFGLLSLAIHLKRESF
jgi:competence protein ComEC